MEDKLKIVKNILKKYNQEHLINFYDELDVSQKDYLLNQILSINFDEIMDLYDKSKEKSVDSTENIEPLDYFIKEELTDNQISYFSEIGEKAIASGKIGIITLAGGQGSRLGFKGPKGTFKLDLKIKKSLFEILCDYIKTAYKKYNSNIMWYIMTSTENHDSTVDFFEKYNYFDYPKENIVFFKQNNLPIISTDGKLILEEVYKVKSGSNGNGDLFRSLEEHQLIQNMEQKGIEWLFVGGVDNVLLNPLDSVFIGLTIASQNDIGAKTILKENPSDTAWVFARKYGKPTIVDCENFVNELSKLKNSDGHYLYREINILAHLFSLNALKRLSKVPFSYHRAFRKSAFVNDEGMKQVPDSANIYKFEKFVFDAFPFFNDILLLRVNPELEFAPIKDYTGPYNPEIAKKLYEKNILHIETVDDE